MVTPPKDPIIRIRQLDAETLSVPIIGTSPLISHNWSEKARKQMLDAMQGVKNPKESKDPQSEFLATLYRVYNEDGPESYGFPSIAFKAATIGAARFFDKSISMTALRQYLFFKGVITKGDPQELFKIDGTPEMREDPVKVGVSGRDLRYRAQFWPWSTTLTVTYVKNSIDKESVLSLIDAGGLGVGIGEWRPERNGAFGMYQIDQARKVVAI